MDVSKYLKIYVEDGLEHLRQVDDLLLELERRPETAGLLDALFRHAHSLKGMSAAMGFEEFTQLAHGLEGFLDRFRQQGRHLDGRAVEILLSGIDLLRGGIERVAKGEEAKTESAEHLFQQIRAYHDAERSNPEGSVPTAPVTPVPEPGLSVRSTGAVRVDAALLDEVLDLLEELIVAKGVLAERTAAVASRSVQDGVSRVGSLIQSLYHRAMHLRMLPLQAVADRFPRLVRDLAKRAGKEVRFHVVGGEIEADRLILEALPEPLVHVIRNAIDHGIEPPDERERVGKSREGTIRLEISKEGEGIVIRVHDDGRGMDPARIKQAAVEKGFLSQAAAEAVKDTEALMLVTLPGLTTAAVVSEVSGRGVGMDAVQETVHALRGNLLLDSQVGMGTTVTFKLPLTLAVISVLMVGVADETYAIPVTQVLASIEIVPEEVRSEGDEVTLIREDETITLISLRSLLGLPAGPARMAVLAEVPGRRVGLTVDRVFGHREVVVKTLGVPLKGIRGLSGTTIMGDGEIVLILDIPGLLRRDSPTG